MKRVKQFEQLKYTIVNFNIVYNKLIIFNRTLFISTIH